MTTVTTKMYLEIEFEIEGKYVPGSPATPPSYSSGGDPPVPDSFEDVTIVGVRCITHERVNGVLQWKKTDLIPYPLGPNTPQFFFDNVLKALGQDEVHEALLDEVAE